jgi:hypothetical protein
VSHEGSGMATQFSRTLHRVAAGFAGVLSEVFTVSQKENSEGSPGNKKCEAAAFWQTFRIGFHRFQLISAEKCLVFELRTFTWGTG